MRNSGSTVRAMLCEMESAKDEGITLADGPGQNKSSNVTDRVFLQLRTFRWSAKTRIPSEPGTITCAAIIRRGDFGFDEYQRILEMDGQIHDTLRKLSSESLRGERVDGQNSDGYAFETKDAEQAASVVDDYIAARSRAVEDFVSAYPPAGSDMAALFKVDTQVFHWVTSTSKYAGKKV